MSTGSTCTPCADSQVGGSIGTLTADETLTESKNASMVCVSIGTLTSAETFTESKKASIVGEKIAREIASSRCVVKKIIAWKTLKNVVFFICLILSIIQSVEFFNIYFKYPTNVVTETTVSKEFRLPAVTLCFRNTISFDEFCAYEPGSCKTPSNVEGFCEHYPTLCKGNTTNSTIPMHDRETRQLTQLYLFNDSFNDALLFKWYPYATKARTFVADDGNLFLKCYSDNLHLYQSGSKPKTLPFGSTFGDTVFAILMNQINIQPFYSPDTPQLFIAIHSPYVPLNPEVDLRPIRAERSYTIHFQLEKEEHLLPPPYQTNCRNNEPSENAKQFTNPNSYQDEWDKIGDEWDSMKTEGEKRFILLKMCLEICKAEYSQSHNGCQWGTTMVSSVNDLCYGGLSKNLDFSGELKSGINEKRLICMQNCKQECLKLYYKYNIHDSESILKPTEAWSSIWFQVKNPEVTVLRHVPLYGSGEIFSHVGGLLGCWLGISVFTFTDIMEKFFKKVGRLKKRFRQEEEQTAPTCEIHLD